MSGTDTHCVSNRLAMSLCPSTASRPNHQSQLTFQTVASRTLPSFLLKNKSEDWFCDNVKSKDQSRRGSTCSSNARTCAMGA
eukprot:3457931-Rhodomonas_salina.1